MLIKLQGSIGPERIYLPATYLELLQWEILRTFIHQSGDHKNVSLPFLRPIFEPITFLFVIPNINAKITRANENRKLMMHAKQFLRFGIVRMHNHNGFSCLRLIPPWEDI